MTDFENLAWNLGIVGALVADAVERACTNLASYTPLLCATCGVDWKQEGCLCRLAGPGPTEPSKPARPKLRDFTDGFVVGQSVRHPKGQVQVCPKCERTGVAVLVPRWRYKPAHTRYVHAAEVLDGLSTVLDVCIVEKPTKKPRRKRVRMVEVSGDT